MRVVLSRDLSQKLKVVFENQDDKPEMMNDVISFCVSFESNQTFSSNKIFVLSEDVNGEGHCKICVVSSSGLLHIGQFECMRLFLITITFPVAISPLTHLEMKIFEGRLASFLAMERTFQFTFSSRSVGDNPSSTDSL